MAGIAAAWRRFWFEPQPTSTLGVVRIAFGIVALVWTLSLAPDVLRYIGDSPDPAARALVVRPAQNVP